MFNRNLPWNQLGIDATGAKTVGEALAITGTDWEVVRNPIFDANGNVINGFFANTRSSDNEVLGVVGPKYQIVQNADAFDFTNSLVSAGVTFEKAGVFHHGKAVWLLAKLPETYILGDKFDPYVVFINSHDGTGSVKICMTPIRIACSNALNFALKNASRSWSTRHMGNITQKLLEAKHTLGLADDYMISLKEDAERLAKVPFSRDQFINVFDRVFPIDQTSDSKTKIRHIAEMKEAMLGAMNADDLQNFKNTAWGAINAVTDYVDHSVPFRNTRNYEENRWNSIANGHQIVDAFFEEIAA